MSPKQYRKKPVVIDFVIKGVADEFYPCKPDIFEKTYEEVVAPHANATVSGTWQNTM